MSSRKKQAHGGGGHGGAWVITFADLVSLLMAFFVMIVSFSSQEEEKLKQAVGSMRDAFGVQAVQRPAGMIEKDGLPVRDFLKSSSVTGEDGAEFAEMRDDSHDKQGPEANTHDVEMAKAERAGQFVSAAMSLRQALNALPDVAELSKNIAMTETKEGLDIQLVDQDGRAMFGEGSSEPAASLHAILGRIAPVLAKLDARVRITGHTEANGEGEAASGRGWRLSSERALATSETLGEYGLSTEQIEAVVGKADTEPLFPEDPSLDGNRRINIVILREAPPFPVRYSR